MQPNNTSPSRLASVDIYRGFVMFLMVAEVLQLPKLAAKFGWKVGDSIALRGTIYPGTWNFTLRGIWDGATPKTDENQLLFHISPELVLTGFVL